MRYFIVAALLLLAACNEDQERYEKIDKLRAIGVEVTPIAAVPSPGSTPSITSLNLYVVQPTDTSLNVASYSDPEADSALFIDSVISSDAPEKTDLNGLFLYKIKANVAIPSAELLPIPPEPGFARLTYGITASAGEETENIIGRILVYAPNDEKTTWTQPNVTLHEPADGATLSPGEIDIKASIESDYSEEWRVSWFVSDGKLSNRRAKETKWETPGSGDHTLILTVRGLNSNTFVIKTAKVKFE